jgi:small-conductance mechanosensitive channel
VHDVATAGQVPVDSLVEQYREWFVSAGVFLVTLLVVYLVGRLLVHPPVVRAVRARNPNDQTLVEAIDLYLRVGFVVLAVPVAVAAAGFGGIAAGSSVVLAAATLALGVAGRDVVGNLVSGVFLVADPDFNVDDYIEWNDRAGTVEAIDLRVTRLRTLGGEVVVVPNTELTTSAVRRPFARDRYRLAERVSVAYDEDLDAVRSTLATVAAGDERVLDAPEPEVHVTKLGGTAVEVTAHFWVPDPATVDLPDVQTDFRTRAVERLRTEGVTVAPADPRELSGELAVRSTDGLGG